MRRFSAEDILFEWVQTEDHVAEVDLGGLLRFKIEVVCDFSSLLCPCSYRVTASSVAETLVRVFDSVGSAKHYVGEVAHGYLETGLEQIGIL